MGAPIFVKSRKDQCTQTDNSRKKKANFGSCSLQANVIDDFKDSASCASGQSSQCSASISDIAYEVDKVLAINTRANRVMYLLKWKDYPYSESTWEDKSALIECAELIGEFRERDVIRNIIASKIKQAFKPFLLAGLWHSMSFYACHEWEDQWNRFAKSYGQAHVFVENWVDDRADGSIPKNFKMAAYNEVSPAVKPILEMERIKFRDSNGQIFCKCEKSCSNTQNCCAKLFKMMYGYTPLGRVRQKFNTDIDWLIECSSDCKCGEDCPSRVVQRGRQIPIVIFRTKDRGWGVRAGSNIPANSFISEYVGMVRLMEETRNSGPLYTYSMDNCGECMFVVDAAKVGNEARFVNHSCDPNIFAISVIVERFGPAYQRIAFFAKRNITKGEELTVNYFASDSGELKKGRAGRPGKNSCLCGSSNCRGYLF